MGFWRSRSVATCLALATGTAALAGQPRALGTRTARSSVVRQRAAAIFDYGDRAFEVSTTDANFRKAVLCADDQQPVETQTYSASAAARQYCRLLAKRVLVPEQVNSEYFAYTRWRCVQRLLSGTVSVFGLQAMIMAIGVRDAHSGKAIGAAAAIDWVLKDALGKVTRLGWAGKMGREFDGDAKRWRFRSSLLYASGNGLQIATFAFPSLFLVLATVANCLKQVSMLTSTATRSAIYRSFAASDSTNNLGDITAKGEAQIAIVDLVGMLLGIAISRRAGFDPVKRRARLLGLYLGLSLLEICAMYREIRCVVFRQLNLERAELVVAGFVATSAAASPQSISRSERILKGPRVARADTFASLSAVAPALQSAELAQILTIFRDDRYLIAPAPASSRARFVAVLRSDAKDDDALDAMLALARARASDVAARDWEALSAVRQRTAEAAPELRCAMLAAGWSTTSFMMPDVPLRAQWGAALRDAIPAVQQRKRR